MTDLSPKPTQPKADAMSQDLLKPSDGFQYYLKDSVYWNDFEAVREYLHKIISGDPQMGWVKYLATKYGARNTGLFVSCGNGWVERDCFSAGLVKEVVGFDVMPELLEIARRDAEAISMPATYVFGDGNNLSLDRGGFDLIVNNGSMHHIAYLDKLLRQMRTLLTPDGLYAIFDYTGSHRNQYSWKIWSKVVEVNHSLPKEYQNQLTYPHMPTMLAMDPTEAIHSELQLEITKRYFDVEQENMLGGAIAYNVLYSNKRLFRDRHTDLGASLVQQIIDIDAEFSAQNPDSNLFTFAVFRPKPQLPDPTILDDWTAEENQREQRAQKNGGRYYPLSAMELIFNEMSDAKYQCSLLEKKLNG